MGSRTTDAGRTGAPTGAPADEAASTDGISTDHISTGAISTDRILTARELNRAMLARQLLLERADLPLTEALERVAGLQTQYSPSGYVGLWARLRNFRREDLTAALEERHVIQATVMRSTIHMVSADDYWPLTAGTLSARREWWLRTRRTQLEGRNVDGACAMVRELLRGHPRRNGEILEFLEANGFSRWEWYGVATCVEMVRVPPSGTWARRRADLYGLAEEWVGQPTSTEAEGRERLLRRYLEGFGPAPLVDIASWAGVPTAAIREAVNRLPLVRRRDEAGRELLDLPGLPLPDAKTPAPVRLLPVWETALLVHARRTQILPERYRPIVLNTKTPHSMNTILVDGQVAGTWRYEKGRVLVEPFERLDASVARELDAEAEELTAFYAD